MAKKKNQHYVPKCYLKQWCSGEDARIHLYYIKGDKPVKTATVRKQCSRNYFYGKDATLENRLSKIESEYATIVTKIDNDNEIDANDINNLKSFALLQHLRTEQFDQINEQSNKQLKEEIASKGWPLPDSFFTPDRDKRIPLTVDSFNNNLEKLYDLEACVYKASGNNQFITSDDPSILTNKFALQKVGVTDFFIPHDRLDSLGALLFLPLSPRHVFVVYDPNIYHLGHKGFYSKINGKDVEAINELQFIRARDNIYFSDWNLKDSLKEKLQRHRKERPENWATQQRYHSALERQLGSPEWVGDNFLFNSEYISKAVFVDNNNVAKIISDTKSQSQSIVFPTQKIVRP